MSQPNYSFQPSYPSSNKNPYDPSQQYNQPQYPQYPQYQQYQQYPQQIPQQIPQKYPQQYQPPQQYQQSYPQQYPQYSQQQYPQQIQKQLSQQYPQQYPQYPQQYPQYPQQQNAQPYQYAPVQYAPQQQNTVAKYPTISETPTVDVNDAQVQQEKDKPKYIVHKIDYSDSLDGLALQYNVSAREIKTFNGLTTDDIYYLKELKIPNPDLDNLHTVKDDINADEYRRQEKLHTMRCMMEKDDHKAVLFYLEDNNWDVNQAIENYKLDLEFEKKQLAMQGKNQPFFNKKFQ